ncbi:MAG: hypothetical protein H7X94_08210 [Vallitaleaceae bacterium]|nr:hypothetical protein [Vallitaleaceae bacterium]
MSERKSALKLTTKVHTGFGIVSFILGLLSVLFFVIAVFISAFEDRNIVSVQYKIGIVEILAFLFASVGLIYGIVGETTKDTFRLFAHLGLAICGISLLFHIFVIAFSF